MKFELFGHTVLIPIPFSSCTKSEWSVQPRHGSFVLQRHLLPSGLSPVGNWIRITRQPRTGFSAFRVPHALAQRRLWESRHMQRAPFLKKRIEPSPNPQPYLQPSPCEREGAKRCTPRPTRSLTTYHFENRKRARTSPEIRALELLVNLCQQRITLTGAPSLSVARDGGR